MRCRPIRGIRSEIESKRSDLSVDSLDAKEEQARAHMKKKINTKTRPPAAASRAWKDLHSGRVYCCSRPAIEGAKAGPTEREKGRVRFFGASRKVTEEGKRTHEQLLDRTSPWQFHVLLVYRCLRWCLLQRKVQHTLLKREATESLSVLPLACSFFPPFDGCLGMRNQTHR